VCSLWLDAEIRKIERLRDTIISAMQDDVRTWPLDARDVDVSIDAAVEFQRMLHVLEVDDLPRFADKFKGLLNKNTIREIAGFQSQLKRERVDTINASLHAIDYNPNRYIALEAAPSAGAKTIASTSTTRMRAASRAARRKNWPTPCWRRAWRTSSASSRGRSAHGRSASLSSTKGSVAARMNRRALDWNCFAA